MDYFLGFGAATAIWITAILLSDAPKEVTYEMINKANQVCYINSNTGSITAREYEVTIKCRNGAEFKFNREDLN